MMLRLPFIQRLVNCQSAQLNCVRHLNGNRALIARIRRKEFCRMYESVFVGLDGSTSRVRYHEPRTLVKFPVVFEDLQTEDERKAWLARRKKKEIFNLSKDELDVSLNKKSYLKHFIKK